MTKQVTPAPSATGQPRREFLMDHQREIERKFSADPGVPCLICRVLAAS